MATLLENLELTAAAGTDWTLGTHLASRVYLEQTPLPAGVTYPEAQAALEQAEDHGAVEDAAQATVKEVKQDVKDAADTGAGALQVVAVVVVVGVVVYVAVQVILTVKALRS